MGNCALKPKVLSEVGAPVPEELKDSLLEDHKNDAAKSLSNLFLQVSRYEFTNMHNVDILGMLILNYIHLCISFVFFCVIGQGREESERR